MLSHGDHNSPHVRPLPQPRLHDECIGTLFSDYSEKSFVGREKEVGDAPPQLRVSDKLEQAQGLTLVEKEGACMRPQYEIFSRNCNGLTFDAATLELLTE